MKRIAVVTPCYNAENLLEDCVESVSKMLIPDDCEVQHVLIDDASTDATKKVIESIKTKNVKKIYLNENKGHPAARNYVNRRIDADYIFGLDADDIIFQNSLERMLSALMERRIDWLYVDFVRTGKFLDYTIGDDYWGWEFRNTHDLLVSIFTGWHIFQQNCIFPLKYVEEVGGYDETLKTGSDNDFYTRLILRDYLPYYLSGPAYIHRHHDSNISLLAHSDPNYNKRNVKTMYNKYENKLKEKLTEKQIRKIKSFLED